MPGGFVVGTAVGVRAVAGQTVMDVLTSGVVSRLEPVGAVGARTVVGETAVHVFRAE
jgi:hypothetical protein